MNELIWLAPLLFIVHDMEEIIWGMSWKKKSCKKYINIPFTPFGTLTDTSVFALAVAEELLLFLFASIIGYFFHCYELWLGILFANTFHLVVIHIIITLVTYRSYVPGLITSILTFIPNCLIIKKAIELLHYSTSHLILWLALGTIITFANLKAVHKCDGLFRKLIP